MENESEKIKYNLGLKDIKRIEKDVYNQAIEDLKNALLNDKFISRFYKVCEKIVEILARLYK